MNLFIPKESLDSEKRVAVAPDNVSAFLKLGYKVGVESGAGLKASFPDSTYKEAGAAILESDEEIWKKADLILKLNPPNEEEASLMNEGATLISFAYPARNERLLGLLGKRKINWLSMDCVPVSYTHLTLPTSTHV